MQKVFIIAEAGVNHNGDLTLAKQLIEQAADAGADAVKFQTYKTENLVCKTAAKAAYQFGTTDENESQYDMLKKLELTKDMHEVLIGYSRQIGIQFLSTPFDTDSIDLLSGYQLETYKIPSGEITNYPYLKKIAGLHKRVILSTGMSTMEEIGAAIQLLQQNGVGSITLLHCTTEYPAPMGEVNLRAMSAMHQRFGLPVGYSDHTRGIEISIAAAAMGAVVIEKHFTLNRDLEGPDHKASLEPAELKAMVAAIRNVEKALGNGEKKVTASEAANISTVRKSIVAYRNIAKGEVFTEENITTKRPGTGISPMVWEQVLGKKAGRAFKKDEIIEL